jgi:hypothetical protein
LNRPCRNFSQVDEVEQHQPFLMKRFSLSAQTEELPAAFADDLPDWIKELAGETPEPSGETTAPPELQAEAPAFLDELATAEAPPSEQETMIPAEMRSAAVLSQIEDQVPVEPEVPEGEEPSGEPSGHAGAAMAAAFLAGLAAQRRAGRNAHSC